MLVQKCSTALHSKKSKLVTGVKLADEEKWLNKFRSDTWNSFLKDCISNSGVIFKENPNQSIVADTTVNVTILNLSNKIFEKVFHSVQFMTFGDVTIEVVNVQCKFF